MGYCLPVVVDLPESTWPITTTLMCIFSLLCEEHGQQPSCARFARWKGVQNGVGNKATYPMMAVFFRICFRNLVFVARF
jgi:hypothetical protein